MKKEKTFLKEFVQFLKEYKVISLAIAFIMGEASTGLVKSLVNDVTLPFLTPLITAETWREAVVHVGPVVISYGSFISELVNFIILAFVVFIVVKKVIKIEQEEKK